MSCCAAQDSISSKRCRCSLLLRRRSRLSRASCRKSGNSLFLGCSCNCTSLFCAPVAQLDRAFGYEPKGREFESLRAHHPFAVSRRNLLWIFTPKTKRPRLYSHGTNRSNRFLPRETVHHQHSSIFERWEWHGCAIAGVVLKTQKCP